MILGPYHARPFQVPGLREQLKGVCLRFPSKDVSYMRTVVVMHVKKWIIGGAK